MSRWCRADAVASQAQAYQRSPLEPPPAERTSQRRGCFSSAWTASAQVSLVPAARVRVKFDGTRSTYAWPRASKNSRSWVQLPYTSSPQAKSNRRPSAYAVAQTSMASCPLVRKDRCTVLIPLATFPAHPRYWRLTPAVAWPAFSCPVSSIAPITIPPRRRAASSRPPAANRRTTLIAADVSQAAWFSSRWVRSGVRSPPRRAILHPFTRGSSLTSADRYLPACSHGSVRAKHGLSSPSSSSRFRSASPAPMLTAAAASDFVLVTQT